MLTLAAQAVCDLMLECLHQDPAQRPTALELLQRLGPLAGPPALSPRQASWRNGGGGGNGMDRAAGSGDGPAAAAHAQLGTVDQQVELPAPFVAQEPPAPASQQPWQLLSPFVAQAGVAKPPAPRSQE